MLYLLMGSIMMFIMSAVFFQLHIEFMRRDGVLPPKVLYRQVVFGIEDKSEILWQTKPLDPKTWDSETKGMATFGLFVVKWGLLGGGLFMLAGFLSKYYGVN